MDIFIGPSPETLIQDDGDRALACLCLSLVQGGSHDCDIDTDNTKSEHLDALFGLVVTAGCS